MGFVELNISGAAKHRKRKVGLAVTSGGSEAHRKADPRQGAPLLLRLGCHSTVPSPRLGQLSLCSSKQQHVAGRSVLHQNTAAWGRAHLGTPTLPADHTGDQHSGNVPYHAKNPDKHFSSSGPYSPRW